MTKVRFIFLLFILCFFLVIVKLFYIQVINPYSNNFDYLKTNKILAERGIILDRNRQSLAINQLSYLLYIEPKKIEDKKYFIRKVSEILKVDEASIEAKLDESKYWIKIKSGLNKETKNKITDLKLKGINFEEESVRYYPEASLAAHLLGFVGKKSDGEAIGYFGVEGFYDKDLVGLPGLLKSERDLVDRPIFFGTQEKIDPENGRDLILTIDKSIQDIIKKKLILGLERYKAKEGCVISANPYTLEIIGLVCLPDFDQDNYYFFSEDYFKNPAISDLYEPGSIFKPLIMAEAIEKKSIKPDDFYDEDGPVKFGEYTIRTWNDKYEGKISMTRILEKSSNVGMVYIGEKLGQKKIYQLLKKVGLGQLTEIDLQGEAPGFLKDESQWYPIDYATVTFGQGIALTPIQMIRAFSSVINGGLLMKPHVVAKIISNDKEKEIKSEAISNVFSQRTSEILKKMLESTVENGEFKWVKPNGYRIGGKTGTAQIPIKGHYDPSKTIASFIGFFPVNNPKIITLVILKEPKTSPWGSETAAPLFFDIAKDLIVYYNIAPEQ